ncbi:MAG: response regulator, partial [Bdellovibrionaceae bacterium]|nr:response regulator [Pseudobdellovibrionaceae bacterium]
MKARGAQILCASSLHDSTLILMTKPRILCVDDEVSNVDALERLLRKKYDVLKATSGAKGLEILDQNPEGVAVIISDQRMPQMTGVEFLEMSLTRSPDSVRMLLTGYTDIESVVEAVNKGQIFRYLTKPWDPIDLVNTVDQAVEKYQLTIELKKKNQELSNALDSLKELDQAKNNFMILINHELKTPLTNILNFLELLRETKMTEEQSKLLVSENQDKLHLTDAQTKRW